MVDRFLQFILKNNLINTGEKTILAVSGGLDSMAMAELFRQAGLPFGIAHCNFQLRGKESDTDEAFVREQSNIWGVPFFGVRFNTRVFASQQGQSIQVAARELRYEWLEKIRAEAGFHRIATAHHLNDAIETALFHFIRGTGLAGLQGIPLRSGVIIRPLIFASRAALSVFAEQHGIAYREDSSNITLKYTRNNIRHQIIPRLRKINPDLEQTFQGNFQRLGQALFLYRHAVDQIRKVCVKETERGMDISMEKLSPYLPAAGSLLYEWTAGMGFHPEQLAQALENARGHSGARFFSPTHQLLVDRQRLIVEKRFEAAEGSFVIPAHEGSVSLRDGLLSVRLPSGHPGQWPDNRNVAFLDADCLEFPLRLRHWQEGDVFCPLGMKGKHQKLQDFFSNQKLSRFEKDRVWILEDAGRKILWIVGYRLDERCKITEQTRQFIVLEYSKGV